MAELTLMGLADRVGINTMVAMINNTDQSFDLDAHRAQYYYSSMMLEKMKIGQENYVFLKYAKKYPIPEGHETWVMRRSFPLTEHTVPLIEGIPPRSDKTKKEKITGTYHQYGRYMEFSDRVEWKLLDPIMSEYAFEFGDVAVRTMHRLARKELLSSTFKNYANNRSNIGELQIGDYAQISLFRLAILKMGRLLVRPVGGSYPVITSEEHMWDLMKDPLILEYLGTNNGLEHYKSGSIPELFNLRFEKTMMDDFAYGYELGNPGEWLDGSTVKCRLYAMVGAQPIYFNIAASGNRTTYVAAEYRALSGFAVDNNNAQVSRSVEEGLPDYQSGATGVSDASETNNRLSNGSWIPVRTRWSTAFSTLFGTDMTVALTADVTAKTAWGQLFYTYDHTSGTVEKMFTLYGSYKDADNVTQYVSIGYVGTAGSLLTAAAIAAAITAGTLTSLVLKQLPVHTAFLLGDEALGQIEVGSRGNVQVFAKPKGSAGVLDPIDQRQSIGFKIDTLGFKLMREEACWLFYHVPSQATATATISLN